MDLKLRTEQQFEAIVQALCPDAQHLPIGDIPGASVAAIRGGAMPLPRSGLRQPAPGVLLFKGGRDA